MAVLSGVGTVGLVAPAEAQDSYPATVTSVVDGDTVDAQVAGGPALEVQLIGINAPELGDCGADEATRYMERFVLGRAVTLVSDPTQPRLDGSGRSLLYVDRDDSLDVGEAILRAGWAEVFLRENDFARLPAYMATEQTAQRFSKERGVAAVGTSTQIAARSFATSAYRHSRTRRYYRRLSNRQFATAWGMLSRRVRRDFGPVASWKAGFRRSLSTTVTAARARLSGRRAVVSVRLRARDRDACTGTVVRQRFRGRWILAPRRGSWVAAKVHMRKTDGGRVRLSKSECAPPRPSPSPPQPSPPPRNCDPSYPTVCIPPPPPDLDCGDIAHTDFRVIGRDPHGFDCENDGVGCET